MASLQTAMADPFSLWNETPEASELKVGEDQCEKIRVEMAAPSA
ncbi:hypothetical protein GCWU000342_01712 [Shuttleworthella satelles DSM 14600]|uniref:Uncharacterized protein n=1 Tax=Shuttleworthella satelles DSM 14600 TaxID=626523 RepID=C4GCL8_9FIRM|nr:hypothetical protein GCWU000342_01712 [Shuttleworthia satelles DSM 14600]